MGGSNIFISHGCYPQEMQLCNEWTSLHRSSIFQCQGMSARPSIFWVIAAIRCSHPFKLYEVWVHLDVQYENTTTTPTTPELSNNI